MKEKDSGIKKIIIGGTSRNSKFPGVWLANPISNNTGGSGKTKTEKTEIKEGEIKLTAKKENTTVFKIKFEETDNSFSTAKPEKGEVIILIKPGKTDVFVSDKDLLKIIADSLNQKKKSAWEPGLWYPNQELTFISALKKISANKISGNIIPFIEKIALDFYGDK